MPRIARALVVMLLCWMGAARARGEGGAELSVDIAQNTAALAVAPDRSAGTAASQEAAAVLARKLAAAGTVYRQRFLLPVPVVERCTATVEGGGPLSQILLSPLLPSGLQIAAMDDGPLPLVYVGKGTLAELRGREVARHLVAMEVDSGPTAWEQVASLGARGVIFLGDRNTPNTRFLEKTTSVPMGLPRFYCDDAPSVAAIRGGGVRTLRIDLRTSWQERELENVLCLIPGRQAAAGPANNARWSDALIVLQTRYDAPSQVLGRAPGATQAANAAVLLHLAQEIATAPEHASVLLAFTAGDEWNLRGTRTLLELLGRNANAAGQTTILTGQLARAEGRVAEATALAAGIERAAAGDLGAARLALVRGAMVHEALVDQLIRESSLAEERLEAARVSDPPANAAAIAALDQRKSGLLAAGAALAGRIPMGPDEKASIVTAAQILRPLFAGDSLRLSARRDALRVWPEIRTAIGPRPPLVFFSLELTAGDSDTFGFFSRSSYARAIDATGQLAGFAQALRRDAPDSANFVGQSLENTLTLESFFPLRRAFSSDAALAFALPAGALATTADPAPWFDTPNDTVERLNLAALQAQAEAVRALLLGDAARPEHRGVLTDPYFLARTDLPLFVADQEVTVYERALGESLARLRAAGTVLAAECRQNNHPLGPPLAGTRRQDVEITFADGTATFPLALRIPGTRDLLAGFTFDEHGRPIRTLIANGSGASAGLATDFYPAPDHALRTMLFDCQRLDAFGLFDPRGLELLTTIDILDARRLDRAAFSNVFIDDAPAGGASGLAALFFPPNLRWQVLAGRGIASNRLVLINADAEHPQGQGFESTDLAELGPLPWRSARDLFALDTRRKTDLEKFGISNEVIRELHADSATQLAAASAARARGDMPAFFAGANGLWALQQQVYENLIATSNGIIRGVIFLLLGIIPFSYFLERLLVGATSVYRQIGWFAAIFCLMTAGLWFHPAFRISAAPMMIILAFFILILSATVVYILWGKFDEEITRLRTSGGPRGAIGEAGHITSLQRGAVLGAAVRLGLSNMRRRPTRTALTLTTLILLTFTLLCFTSVRESVRVSPVRLALSVPVPPPGILIRQRSWRELPPQALDLAAGLALPVDVTLPATAPATQPPALPGPIAGRWWFASQRSEEIWSLPVKNPATGDASSTSALVGLEPAEAAFHAAAMDTILPGFSAASPEACWLPEQFQSALHLRPNDAVILAGRRLRVAGFFTDVGLSQLRQLTDDPLTPLDPSGGGGSSAAAPADDSSGRPETRAHFFPSSSIAIVPAAVARDLGARLTSIVFRPGNVQSPQDLERLAEAFARRADITVYASDGITVRGINATAAARPQDFSTVLVPMLIAGVIVLNTMLGAVAERTREIHVYTSVGLAPAHVGMLFLAEAAALGTLGVVFGYIFGQGLATLLAGTHVLPGVDLNYSSLSAIVTMGAVLGLVMLSALWPARAASRVAAPSLAREWRLPPAVGDILDVELPFTVNETAAKGVCAFLAEYFTTASQSGAGKFTVDNLQPFQQADPYAPDPAHGQARGLLARVWLEPYDLGVIQGLRLAIHPTAQPTIFDVRVRLTREAGNPATWQRLNRPFLTDIRKQFLLWRTLPPESVARYVEISNAFFKGDSPTDSARSHEDVKPTKDEKK